MLYGVYAMRDVKTGFMTPSIDVSDESAVRNFTHAVCHSDGVLRSFAQDFSLYKIGEFDSDTAELLPLRPTLLLIEGSTALRYGGNTDAE